LIEADQAFPAALRPLGLSFGAVGEFVEHNATAAGVTLAGLVALFFLGRSNTAVEFGEANAIDVEGMGLYWHFVDIVWIVIFTAVYLLEYL